MLIKLKRKPQADEQAAVVRGDILKTAVDQLRDDFLSANPHFDESDFEQLRQRLLDEQSLKNLTIYQKETARRRNRREFRL